MKNFIINAQADVSTIDVIGDIGDSWFSEGITAESINNQLKAIKSPQIILNVSSLGGSVFDALAIYDLIQMHPAKVTAKIIGVTASSGTIIALAADRVEISDNALFLVHNASAMSGGNAVDLRKTAAELDKVDARIVNIYKKKTGKNITDIKSLMAEDKFIDAKEALSFGFVDSIFKPLKAVAYVSNDQRNKILNKLKNKMEYKAIKNVIGDFEMADGNANFNDEILGVLETKLADVEDSKQVDIDEAVATKLQEFEAAKELEIQAKLDDLAAKTAELDAKQAEIDALKAEKETEVQAKVTELDAKVAELVAVQAMYDDLDSKITAAEANGTKLNGEPLLFKAEKTEKEKQKEANAKHVAAQLKKF